MTLVVALLMLPATDGSAQPTAAIASDPDVQQAQAAVQDARRQLEATSSRLDALAGSFENARAHSERLANELDGADVRLTQAEAAAAAARAAQATQVRAAYMQPGIDLVRVSGAFLLSPDVSTALHASAMMQRIAASRAVDARSAVRAGQQVVADVSSQRGVATGTAAAMQDLQSLAATFTDALDLAAAELTAAESALADAELAAEQRAHEAALAASMGAVWAVGGAGPIRIATINGGTQEMTCPLGQPNGFIDSWGFPRSGGRSHRGVDMFAAYGMPVYAAADGHVRRVFNNRLGGLSVDLIDGLGNRYYYAHLSATYVVGGQQVGAGQLIAANGNSGNARFTPPHLHWQFHPGDGAAVNPFPLAAALCR